MVDKLKKLYYYLTNYLSSYVMKLSQSVNRFFTEIIIKKIIQFIRLFSKIIHNILKKGPEHLTVMLIPHSEKRIFTLHISYFTLFFAVIVIVAVIVISSFSILSTSTTKQEYDNLLHLAKTWNLKEKRLQKQIDLLNKSMEGLKPEIEKLYSSAAQETFINLYARGGSSDFDRNISKEQIHDKLPDEFYDLEQIKNDIQTSKKYIQRVRDFIKEREELFSKIPSIWPLKVGGYITDGYGWRKHPFYKRRTEWHKGIDIASWPGAPIVATASGTVKFAGWNKGYGLTVIIKHAYGFETRYAHLSRIRAYTGKKIKRGDVIGYLGKSGMSTGYHLHYEVRIGLADVNPWPYIINIK